MNKIFFITMLTVLYSTVLLAQDFSSNFSDGNFCEFDLQRLPISQPQSDCGPFAFVTFARIKNSLERQFVQITMTPDVPFNKKYLYKMELSVPNSKNFYDQQTVQHDFSVLVPQLPQAEKFFPQLSDSATAFVIAQWHASNGKSPPLALRLTNRKELLITIDKDIDHSIETERETLWRGSLPENAIMDFSVLSYWHPQHGRLQILLNDVKIVDYTGPLGQHMDVESPSYYFKYGLYHSYKDDLAKDFKFSILLGELRQQRSFKAQF